MHEPLKKKKKKYKQCDNVQALFLRMTDLGYI